MLKILEKAMTLSKQISDCIAKGDWKNTEKLQLERDKILAKLPTTKLPSDKNELQQVSELTLKVKEMTQAQLINSKERKDNLLHEIKNNNKSKKMKAAYQPP